MTRRAASPKKGTAQLTNGAVGISDTTGAHSSDHVDGVRRFNRFYTRRIGILDEAYAGSAFTLTEARVVHELAQRGTLTATQLVKDLGLDAGYMSRIVRSLHGRGVIAKRASPTDARETILSLSKAGQRAFARLDAAAVTAAREMLDPLPPDQVARLVGAMSTVEAMLSPVSSEPALYLLRPHKPGDMGWIIHRQAVLYAQEYGWGGEYEALITRIMADFLEHFDPQREHCWVVERDGQIVGSVFVVKHPEREGVAKLRLLYVEPSARGLGIGRRLVQEVTQFARQAGYHTLTLWTNTVLVAARRLYEEEGYQLVAEEPHNSFGQGLIAQTWERAL